MSARSLAALLGLAVFGIAGPSYSGEPRVSRMRVSQSGRFAVRLTESGPGQCALEVLKDSAPHWTLNQCVGTADDLYFVSDDGERFWVLRTLPEKPRRRPKKARRAAWTRAQVAAEYDRSGKEVAGKRLFDLVPTRGGLDEVRQLETHFKWLEGVLGVPGTPPRLNEAGQIELVTIDHRQHRLKF